jgi:hypothetical protein
MKDHAPGIKRYLDGIATVRGLDPDTTYCFGVELLDARGSTSGPQPIGGNKIPSPQPSDVWEFFAKGVTYNFQTVNRFNYDGAAPYVLNYDNVEVYNNHSGKPHKLWVK